MRAFHSSPLAVFILGGASLLCAQTAPPTGEPISTDRPAIANSSVVVPKGSIQVENGMEVTNSQGQTSVDGPETWFRFGVAKSTELRLAAPDFLGNLPASPAASVSGFGDLSIGLKQQLGPVKQFDVSVILFLSLPSGAAGVSSHGYDPGVQAPWSRKLSANWSAAGQVALYWPTQGNTRNLTGEFTYLFDRQLTSRWDAFAEYAGDFPRHGGPRNLLHFGAVCKVAQRHQVDFHVGVGLSSAAVDHFIGVGYSFRLRA